MNTSHSLPRNYWVPRRFRSQQNAEGSTWVVKEVSEDAKIGVSYSPPEVVSFKEGISTDAGRYNTREEITDTELLELNRLIPRGQSNRKESNGLIPRGQGIRGKHLQSSGCERYHRSSVSQCTSISTCYSSRTAKMGDRYQKCSPRFSDGTETLWQPTAVAGAKSDCLQSKEREIFSRAKNYPTYEKNGKEMEDYRFQNHNFKTFWTGVGSSHMFPEGTRACGSRFSYDQQPISPLQMEKQPISWKHSNRPLPDVDVEPLSCPICMELLDETDSSFSSCSCGFKLCLFCHHTIATKDGRCPGCRKSYDPKFNERCNPKASKSTRGAKPLRQQASGNTTRGKSSSSSTDVHF